ncbi:uncharacterized protein LOC141664605 [Apium graveolens]|uniref:uncharacterized protein LOC141664605 n=1 Tax=Apium graveolens TaxID=4045 RepID=UPI003D7A67FF
MAVNEYQNPTERLPQGKVAGILEVDTATAIGAQLKVLTMKVDSLTNYGVHQIASICELCAGAHATDQCAISSESAYFVSNFQRPQQQVPAAYHPNNRNHPIFSWSNNQSGMHHPQQLTSSLEPSHSTLLVFNNSMHQGNNFNHKEYNNNLMEVLKQKIDKQFAKFLEVFKKLHITIPFTKALEQMPSYAKFMKGILSQKLKLKDLKTVVLTKECSVVQQHKLPPKLKYSESFTIPCTIGKLSFDKCLCDLGASINLMPLSVFRQLGLPDPKPINIFLQLADRSITYPRDEEECYKVELVDSVMNSEIEQLLRLAVHEYYFLLDGYSGYNQICIAPEDQEKTTFTSPFGTFAFRRVSFGLCGEPATFQRCMMVIFSNMIECLAAFEILKKKLTTAPVITAPDMGEPFQMMCDASDFAVGAVLGQRKKNIFHVVYYASKTLNDAQLNYTTTEKELLAVVYGFEKFRSYLHGTKVTVYTDHTAIKYLVSKKDSKP